MRILITVVVSAAAAAVLLWLVLFALYALLRPDGTTLRDGARILPDSIRLVHRLARDRNLSRGVRFRLLLLLGYLAIPFDLVPDFIPLIGYADDAIIMGIVLRSVIRRAGPEVVRQQWPGSDEALHALGRLCRITELTRS
jgi:uncharacterized membrane protein YkvA (DUF1232 family)